MTALLQISSRIWSERILQIEQYLTKSCVDYILAYFFGPPCMYLYIGDIVCGLSNVDIGPRRSTADRADKC